MGRYLRVAKSSPSWPLPIPPVDHQAAEIPVLLPCSERGADTSWLGRRDCSFSPSGAHVSWADGHFGLGWPWPRQAFAALNPPTAVVTAICRSLLLASSQRPATRLDPPVLFSLLDIEGMTSLVTWAPGFSQGMALDSKHRLFPSPTARFGNGSCGVPRSPLEPVSSRPGCSCEQDTHGSLCVLI